MNIRRPSQDDLDAALALMRAHDTAVLGRLRLDARGPEGALGRARPRARRVDRRARRPAGGLRRLRGRPAGAPAGGRLRPPGGPRARRLVPPLRGARQWRGVAADADEIAGVALCDSKRNGAWGWVDTLGVRPAWRRRGIGEALIRCAFLERGERTVALQVDAQSHTGATRLYEHAGMHVLYRIVVWEKILGDD